LRIPEIHLGGILCRESSRPEHGPNPLGGAEVQVFYPSREESGFVRTLREKSADSQMAIYLECVHGRVEMVDPMLGPFMWNV
jgi:hypothetical protein